MSRMDTAEIGYLLDGILDLDGLLAKRRYGHVDRETVTQMLDTAAKLADELFAPHNHAADANEPDRGPDGKVVMVPEVKRAVDAFAEAGFLAAHHDEERGGLQLPWTVVQAAFTFFQTANVSTSAYPFLTIGAANLIEAFGSEEQKQRFLAHMLTGRFFGTMALSEPQAGSSLADIRTAATPNEDGSYAITGTKQWISAGEHELSENIVHMVLAKIKGAPAGVKGISLFIVPRYRVNEDGSLGPDNDVKLVSLLHKMGYRGTTSTILSFGEEGRCRGFLVGKPHHGLAYMFHMMNEARIGVGLGAASLGYAGYRYSAEYARTRPQGRLPDAKDPTTPMVPIIEHADVRRMLLQQKAASEGAIALCLYCARLVDEQRTAEDDAAREKVGLLLDILTPIAKSWPSEHCLEANKWAIQILGGYGYTRDYPVEQYYRDNRLNPIHEGTYGIQAADLLGRKVFMREGAALALLAGEMRATIAAARQMGGEHGALLAEFAGKLADALATVDGTTRTIAQARAEGRVAESLSNATAYLEMFGHTVLAWIWLKLATVSARALAEGRGETDFHRGKLAAARYFYAWELPKIGPQAALVASLDRTTLDTVPDWL